MTDVATADRLWEALGNALLVLDKKSDAGDAVAFSGGAVYASNDFVAIRTSLSLGASIEGPPVYLSSKEAKHLQKMLEGDDSPELPDDLLANLPQVECPSPEMWENIFRDLNGELYRGSFPDLIIHPARISKLSLLHPRGSYPIHMVPVLLPEGQQVISFKYGPNTNGLIAPLLREDVEEWCAEEEVNPTDVLWKEVNRGPRVLSELFSTEPDAFM